MNTVMTGAVPGTIACSKQVDGHEPGKSKRCMISVCFGHSPCGYYLIGQSMGQVYYGRDDVIALARCVGKFYSRIHLEVP